MEQPNATERRDPAPLPEWLARKIEQRLESGAGPDWVSAQKSLERLRELHAKESPPDPGTEDVDDIIDAMGRRKNVAQDWPVVPWSYWEARGAGPYRR